jgi:hypothetical protein
MSKPEDRLVWPDDYPPKGGWKLFFLGIPWLGPDLSFLRSLRDRQARRTEASMNAWHDERERAIARTIGQSLRDTGLGWLAPYFLPTDRLAVIAHGTTYRAVDDLAFEAALYEIEKKLGRKFSKQFWEAGRDFSFQSLVAEMIDRTPAAG